MDPRSLCQIWDDCQPRLLLIARSFGDSSTSGLAEDAVQEAFIELARQTTLPSDSLGWLVRVVRNRMLDWRRRDQRRERRERQHGGEIWFQATDDNGLSEEQNQRWHEGPWKEEYADQIRDYLQPYQALLSELDRATPCMDVDYPMLTTEMSLRDSVSVLLPEIQRSREVGRLLKLRGRMEMQLGQWNEFEKTVRTMFRLSDMVGRSNKILVTRLVAFAIQGMTNGMVEQASAIHGAPNFYWALAAVPSSLFEIRDSLDYEIFSRPLLSSHHGPLPDTMIGAERSRALLREVFGNAGVILETADMGDQTIGQLAGGLAVVALSRPAKEYLRDTTSWGQQAEQLSNAEAVLRATQLELGRITSDTGKWFWLPEEIRRDHLNRSEEALTKVLRSPSDYVSPAGMLFGLLMPAVQAADAASIRGRQTQYQLITLQAVRDYAAKHDQLPQSLDEMNLPAWPDPIGQGGFSWRHIQATEAVLTHSPSYPGDRRTAVRIELKR